MFKNFIPFVRKSLYDKKGLRDEIESTSTLPAKGKKEKINRFEEYNSEHVFASDQNITEKSSKIVSNPKAKAKLTKKLRRTSSEEYLLNEKGLQKVRKRKKRSLSSSCSDLVINNQSYLSPSKSELKEKLRKRKLPKKKSESTNGMKGRSSLMSLSSDSYSNEPKTSKSLLRRNSFSASSHKQQEVPMDCSIIKSPIRKSSSDVMDVGSFQIEDLNNGDEFNWDDLLDIGTESTISIKPSSRGKTKKKIKRNVRRSSTLDSDDTDTDFNLENFSQQADLGTPINEDTDFDCSFIARKLKNVKIESAVVVDESLFNSESQNNLHEALHNANPIPLEKSSILEEKKDVNKQLEITADEDNSVNFNDTQNDTFYTSSTETDTTNTITPTEKNFRATKTKYIAIDSKRVVVLKNIEQIPVFGFFTLKVLYGKLEVLGNILHKNSPEANLYSPRGSALLYLRNANDGSDDGFEDAKKWAWFGKYKLEETDTVLECVMLKDTRIHFIEQYIPHQIFPKIYGGAPRVVFEPKDDLAVISIDDSWTELIDSVTPMTKLMITGGKGVGKSTFLRYSINRLLCTYDKVRVIDLDPGQSEFTLPGGISAVTVEEPIFGPNYTHLKKPERFYLCGIDVGHDPKYYIDCINCLMEYVNNLESIPTIINYMGFVKGLGINIVSSAITFIKPTDIVQINSAKRKNNFVNDLSVMTVMQNCHLFGNDGIDFEYNLHILNSLSDKNNRWTLEPRQMREICVLAYLGDMMTESAVALTSFKLPMYIVRLSSVKIVDVQGASLCPSAVNANLVALCTRCQNSRILSCHGFGVVRGIDLQQNYLILLTPEDPAILDNVEYLVMTRVSLPPAVYMSPQDVEGNIPYVMDGELVSLAQITRRSYLPVNKK